jgi:hypothetical protein
MQRRLIQLTAVVVLSIGWIGTAHAIGYLEIVFSRGEVSENNVVYGISVRANKDFATTCELTTPNGTYSLTDIGYVGGDFSPDQSFTDDHTGMSFAELTAVTAGTWTLTWDAGAAQTVAAISFGVVQENDFPLIPELMAPVSGMPIKIPGDPNPPTLEWTYGSTPPCTAQPDAVEAAILPSAGAPRSSGYLPCNALSWTPPSPLEEGTWFSIVVNHLRDYRHVPDGIEIVEGTWTIENDYWLSLYSGDISENEVVPTKARSWGAIKALYRQ